MIKKNPEFYTDEGAKGRAKQTSQAAWAQQSQQYTGFETPLGAYSGQFPYNTPVSTFGLCYDIFEEGEHLIVEVPFPGLIRDTLNVVQENQWIRVQGTTQMPVIDPSGQRLTKEILCNQVPKGIFDQTILLPCEVEGTSTTATFSNGILTIKVKKVCGKNASTVKVSFQ